MPRISPWLPLAVPLLGCPPSLTSEGEQLSVADNAVVDLVGPEGPNPFLEGQEFCPSYACALDEGCPDGVAVDACISASWVPGSGAELTYTGDCVRFTTPGTVDLEIAPVSCGEPARTPFAADGIRFEVVPADQVTGYTALYYEKLLAGTEPDPDEGILVRPEDWLPAEGEPWRVARDQWMTFYVHLRHNGTGADVAWSSAEWSLPGGSTLDPELTVGNAVRLMPRGTEEQELILTTDAGNFVVTRFQPVDAMEVASLELATLQPTNPGFEGWVFARAVTKDVQGRIILGSPVTWSAEQMVITTASPGLDYAFVADLCRDRSTETEEITVHLTASLGLLSDTREIRYTFTPPAEPNPDFAPDERCTDACGCAPTEGAAAATLGAGAGLAGWALRRRRMSG